MEGSKVKCLEGVLPLSMNKKLLRDPNIFLQQARLCY